jgi:hypothetical protein
MTKERGLAIVGYGTLTVLFAVATAWTVVTGLARLDLLGNTVEVQLTECHREGGGRGGTSSVCSGPQVGTAATHMVKVGYDGRRGEVIRAA